MSEASVTDVSVEDYSFYTSLQLSAAIPMYRLTATQYDVWHTMLGHMRHGGWVSLTLEEIADRLGSYQSYISPALTVLRERGLLWREGPGLWRINPRVAFRGSIQEWNEAMESIPEDVPEVLIPQYQRRPPRASKQRAPLHAARLSA